MIYYVAHKFNGDAANIEKARKITHDLQVKDMGNTYICPLLAMSHLQYGEVSYEKEMDLCGDLLCCCDALLVASEVSEGVKREIELARKIHMEVEFLNENKLPDVVA